MTLRCGWCDRKLAEVEDGARGTIALVCPRCGRRNTLPLDSTTQTGLRLRQYAINT